MTSPKTPDAPKKGILLAGGSGSRLWPATYGISKQLLPVYDKPLVYYSLTTLMMSGARDVLVICAPGQSALFQAALGDGSAWGMKLTYAVQDKPRGIADAFRVAARFLDGEGAALALGDNIFYGDGLQAKLQNAWQGPGACIFLHRVEDAERYGVAAFDADGHVVDIVEKPRVPPSNHAVTGLYFYDASVVERAARLKPSPRGELEITDLNRSYLRDGRLRSIALGRGSCWLDTGTPNALLNAANFVRAIQERQGLMIASPEEIAYRLGWIDRFQLGRLARALAHTEYGRYLAEVADAPRRAA